MNAHVTARHNAVQVASEAQVPLRSVGMIAAASKSVSDEGMTAASDDVNVTVKEMQVESSDVVRGTAAVNAVDGQYSRNYHVSLH